MTELAIILGIGGLALLVWHRVHSQGQQQPAYYGAPAWPAMGPQIVPDIGLPYGIQQAATYYGVDSTLLEKYTA